MVKFSDNEAIYQSGSIWESLFCQPKHNSGIGLSLSTGYIVSAVFYLVVDYFPEKRRSKYFGKIALKEISGFCTDGIMLLVAMYKNVCSKEEWDTIHITDDKDFFDDSFYQRMTKFDGYADADSLLMAKDDSGCEKKLTWDDILEMRLQEINKQVNAVISQYVFFIDEELLELIYKFRDNSFSSAFLGLTSGNYYMQYTGIDGQKYAERLPLSMVRKDVTVKKTPLFAENSSCDNSQILKDFVNSLLDLRKMCVSNKAFRNNIAIKNYCDDGCGKTGNAIYYDKKYNSCPLKNQKM